MTLLAGDVGGTNVRIALFEVTPEGLVETERRRFGSRDHRDLESVLAAFLSDLPTRPALSAAGFGVAGAASHGRVEATNLPWTVDGARVARALSLPGVALVNDLVANALGLLELPASAFATLNHGDPDPAGVKALCSAGTGLGEGFLVPLGGGRWRAYPSEGGHASFAPRSRVETRLLEFLWARWSHVSWERVVSGPGLANVYAFERETSGDPEPAWLAAAIAEDGAPAAVSAAALERKDAVSERALDRFVSLYGAEAGNLALKTLATGGVYLGGGIPPKILPKLLDGTFLGSFCDKGRFAPLLAKVPVYVVLDDSCALRGAARAGAEEAAPAT